MGRTVPYYQLHICMIAHAQNKRRGQTKVFPLLLIPLLFLGIVRRFPFGKLHGHYVFAGIRLSRCPRFEEVL